MKLISWNVNGIRALLNKGFLGFIKKARADVICLQETKAAPDQVASVNWPKAYHQFWNPAQKKGYSGTAIFSRIEPESVSLGIGNKAHDLEGRVISLEFADFHLVNVYTPNSQQELARLDYRTRQWDVAFRKHLEKLEKKKPVIFCGDLNVAHKEIDIARPKENQRTAGFTIEERRLFDRLLKNGYIDTFREFETGPGHYSWWSYRSNAREKNIGWRLDYVCISQRLRPRLDTAFIWPHVMGSDHCPVGMDLK